MLASALAVGLGSSQAAPTRGRSSTASGSFTFQSQLFSKRAGGTFAEITQFTYKGAIAGIAIDHGTDTFQNNGSFSGKGTEYCAACRIAGKSGAFIARYTYTGSGNSYSGTETFTQGFGKLAGLKGGGTFKGNIKANSNTYTYHYTP